MNGSDFKYSLSQYWRGYRFFIANCPPEYGELSNTELEQKYRETLQPTICIRPHSLDKTFARNNEYWFIKWLEFESILNDCRNVQIGFGMVIGADSAFDITHLVKIKSHNE